MKEHKLSLTNVAALGFLLLTCSNPLPSESRGPEQNKFNVLFLAVDDLRPELGCYGVDSVQTPNIDSLAAGGVVFLNHFAAVPTCGASRYALLTGRSPATTGVRGGNAAFHKGAAALLPERLEGAQSLPELFRRSGYHTTLIGKLSHTADGLVYAYDGGGDGRPELPQAWDELATPYGPWQRGWGAFFAYAGGKHREDGEGHRQLMEFVAEADEDLPDGLLANAAIAKLTEFGASKQRFFLGVGFYKPHLPFVATRQDWEAVQTWEHPPALHPEPIDSAHAPSSGEFYGYDMPWPKPRPLAAEHRRQARLAYLACVRYVDRQIGRVLQALEDQDLEDSTIVVLWGDHGWFLGEGAIWGKHTPLELAVRSPLIIRAPGSVLQGASTAALASTLDVYPTLVDLCRPAFTRTRFPLDGESLAPILRGQRDQVRELARSYWNTATSLRSSSHRLIFRERKDKRSAVELYAVSEAASWSQDVAAEHPEIVEALLGAAERLP